MIRSSLPAAGLIAVVGAALQLHVSGDLPQNLIRDPRPCRVYLCDDLDVASFAYKQQLKNTRDSLPLATSLLRDLLIRDPASGQRWADLGDALAQAGSIAEARRCFDRAIVLGHDVVGILISTGDFHLRYGDRTTGLKFLARTLSLTTEYDEPVFSYFTARDVPMTDRLQSGLPPQPRVAASYLRYLMQQGTLADTRPVWQWAVSHSIADAGLAAEYSTFLLAQHQYAEAANIWASQARTDQAAYRKTEFLYNGDYERPFAASPFDWKIAPTPHVEIGRDSHAYSGKYSLGIRFDGAENTDFRGLSQKTVLPPGRYRFQAFVRTEDLTTDQGVYVQISDAEAGSRLTVETQPLLGTSEWHPIAATFVVSSATRLLDVRVMRRPSLRFDNKIAGAVWLDQASLTRLP